MSTKRSVYNYGTAARKADVRTAIYEAPNHQVLRELEGEKKKSRKMRMSFLYVAFLALSVGLLGKSLISYVQLQADITASNNRISNYESTLNNLTLANDDEYSKMVNAVDLEEVKRIAVEELGMVYADESQIITYQRENSDYVRQLKDIPD